MQPVYVDIHIHTSENPNIPNEDYDVEALANQLFAIAQENPVLISLTDHNMVNKKAYLMLKGYALNLLLGVELHIKKYEEAPPYHCHILFDCDITEENIDKINELLNGLYPDKVVTDSTPNVPNIERISNTFDSFDYILLPHGGQSHRTFDKATAKGHRFDTSMERSIYYNHFEGFTARSNSGVEDTKSYFRRLGIDQFTNLITCSDNYNPSVYPSAKAANAEQFVPTWILSEPTFSGLKLALSEASRLFYGDTPPAKWYQSIFGVKLNSDKCDIDVSLAPGLNVVIGGSSSGKTLFVDSVVRGIRGSFEKSDYSSFGVEQITVYNPTGIVPHYINQNFIIQVLKDQNLDLGDIALINDVFPEEGEVTGIIRSGLAKLDQLIDKLIDAVKKYEQYQEALTHIENLPFLIVTKKTPQRISDLFKPSADEKGKFSLSLNELEGYIQKLNEISKVFERSTLGIPYKSGIETLVGGLRYIHRLTEINDEVYAAIDMVMSHEIERISEDDRENSQKIEQRRKLRECICGLLQAINDFNKAKNELASFDIEISTKEIVVEGHRLSIINSFRLTQDVLVEEVNKYIKADKRITSFDELCPETLYKSGFSERPKVNGYDDFARKIKTDISSKNRRTYQIITSDGREFSKLSPGWKSAIILDLLLGYDGDYAPLIIDQPEDNLATDYINHDLVEHIKKIKPKKQIVLVSHNATIPMLGDAQNVIVCINNGDKIIIRSAALESSIDGKRVLDSIAEITDGGKPSIRKRVKKYDLKKYTEEGCK